MVGEGPRWDESISPWYSLLSGFLEHQWELRWEERWKERNFISCVDAGLSLSLICVYYSLVKEYPWAENLTSLSKREVGTLLSVSAFTTKGSPCMLTATHWRQICWSTIAYNGAVGLGSSHSDGTQHFEWQNVTMSMVWLVSAAPLASYSAKRVKCNMKFFTSDIRSASLVPKPLQAWERG